MVRILSGGLLVILWSLSASTIVLGGEIDFNRDVQPILSGHCYKCHGPDESARQGGLRLDVRETATAEADSGAVAIVPDRPDESELVRRIFAEEEYEQMPPAEANKPLTDQQKQILRQWIAEGAEYEPHWAFVPPVQAPLPEVNQTDWPRNAIDHFILARLEAEGLTPSPEADRYALARRLYLDLIGLPPTPDELAQFVDDPAPDAYEQLVDRLLASPHYGERWARRWLDLARYADTNGYEKDRVRSMWPYRDWVIRALNRDMPFDQFTIEQLAGDLLPEATLEQRIATGFHRNTMINEEGGIDPLEFRYHATVDRANTTGTVWLGLTVGCAQCHTHKFDPLTHTEYYSLLAYLNNANEPVLSIPRPEIAAERIKIERQIAQLEADLPYRFPPAGEYRWHETSLIEAKSATGATIETLPDGSLLVGGPSAEQDVYTIVVDTPAGQVDALQLEALTHESLGNQGPGRTPHGNFVVSEIVVTASPRESDSAAQPVSLVRGEADFSQTGFEPAGALDGNPQTGWAIAGDDSWNVNRRATFFLDAAVEHPQGTRWTIRLEQNYGGKHTLGRFRLRLGTRRDDQRPIEVRRAEHLEHRFAAWLDQRRAETVSWSLLEPVEASSAIPTLSILEDRSIVASGDQSKRDVYTVRYANPLERITAIRIEALPEDRFPQRGPGRVAYEGPFGDFFLSELVLHAGGQPSAIAEATHSYAHQHNTAAAAIDGDPHTGWAINGGQGRAHTAVFRLEEPLTAAEAIELQLVFEKYYAAGLGRFRLWATDASPVPPARDLPTSLEPLLRSTDSDATAVGRNQLLAHILAQAPELDDARAEIDKLRDTLPAFPTTLVMQERPAGNPRQTHVHRRGEFLQPTDPVEPGLPELFTPWVDEAPTDRLEFARWLVSPANPLVGRVTVNRQWAVLFGRGLVVTTEDFGYQGQRPTHPELLDWLAVEFVERGWSLKALHRLIVTSATYRQSSRVTEELLSRDPQNELLARAPRVRLDAELIRDVVLRSSGLLSTKLGGPSVFPPQPPGVSSEGAYGPLAWKVSTGEDRYRRGLYTFAKRTAPYAMFSTFDAPSGEACVARREVSNTPLQALTLLNDDVLIEAARELGVQLVDSDDVEQGIRELFLRCLGRPPQDGERELVADFIAQHRARLADGELDAAAICGVEDATVERAAWTLTARAILNLDEVVTKD